MLRTLSLLLATLTLGCSVSNSLDSSSGSATTALESLASPFESSSGSSEGGAEETAKAEYLQDVEAYTVAFLGLPEGDTGFVRGLGVVAAEHGVNDWEADPQTFEVIESAAQTSGVDPQARERLLQQLAAHGLSH